MTRFKRGELTKDAFAVIMYDLETLEIKDNRDQQYHYRMLKDNLSDIFGFHYEEDFYGEESIVTNRKRKK